MTQDADPGATGGARPQDGPRGAPPRSWRLSGPTRREQPLFLERAAYHRRRLGDAARVLPVLACAALIVPAIWLPDLLATGRGFVVIIGTWLAVVLAIAALHWAIARADARLAESGEETHADVGSLYLSDAERAAEHLSGSSGAAAEDWAK